MSFVTVNPGTVKAIAGSYLQDPSFNPANPQAMFTSGGQYLSAYLGGGNTVWAFCGLTYIPELARVDSIWNGGHADASDNGHYSWDINVTQAWSRLVDPTFISAGRIIPVLGANPAEYTDTLGDFGPAGAVWPASRHSYMGNIWMPSKQQVWMAGGSPWGASGGATGDIWWYNPVTFARQKQAEGLPDGLGISAVWDPHVQRILFHGQDHLRQYNPDLAAGSRISNISSDEGQWTAASTACYDWRRRRYVMFGNHTGIAFSGNGVSYYNLMANSNFANRIDVAVTGGMPTFSSGFEAPGCAYDLIRDKYVVWQGYTTGTANDLWFIDPDSFVATKLTFSGDAVPVNIGSTWSRFLYEVNNDVYLLFNDHAQNAVAFRHPDQSLVFAMTNRDL